MDQRLPMVDAGLQGVNRERCRRLNGSSAPPVEIQATPLQFAVRKFSIL